MHDRETVIKGMQMCISPDECSPDECPYYIRPNNESGLCWDRLMTDALELLKEQDEEHRRLLSWLGKFCRHIDNGDKWLSDEENIAFFKEKMKQQFGWNTD